MCLCVSQEHTHSLGYIVAITCTMYIRMHAQSYVAGFIVYVYNNYDYLYIFFRYN